MRRSKDCGRSDGRLREARERYAALPLPTTQDESWRFTDLKGFDPDSFQGNGATGVATAPGMLELEAAGIVRVSEAGLEIERAPERASRSRRFRITRVWASSWGSDEKFAAHNAAMWEHGLLVQVPKGVVLEQPLYIRVINDVEGGSLFWRLLVVAEPQSRFTVIEEYASTDARPGRLRERGRRDLRRGGREGRVRLGAERLAGDVALRHPSRPRRARRRAGLGRRRLRLEDAARSGSRTTSRARAPPRA